MRTRASHGVLVRVTEYTSVGYLHFLWCVGTMRIYRAVNKQELRVSVAKETERKSLSGSGTYTLDDASICTSPPFPFLVICFNEHQDQDDK